MPFKKGRKKTGGRPKGKSNKTTLALKDFVAQMLDKPEYRASLEKRMIEGSCAHIERYAFERVLGKAVEHIEVTGNVVPLFAITGLGPNEENDDEV